jgi:hypothetical protein
MQSTLTTLDLNRVQLSSCGMLCCLAVLEKLNISNNVIEEGDELCFAVRRLQRLRSLQVSGNPVMEGPMKAKLRGLILATCASLTSYDGKTVTDNEKQFARTKLDRKQATSNS